MIIDFSRTFCALTDGKSPFRWQQRLFDHFVRRDLPDACDIPTGLGKTSVMAIWLAALDLTSRHVRLPRRLIYVVDRRAVVDQATEEAEQLATVLGDGTKKDTDPVIATLRKRLQLEPDRMLAISTLRGQLADNRAWLGDPAAASIVVGTVDMIGSRLLFQGYGVSARMRPVHAALLGADALIVLDEAHLVPPFEALVRAVAKLTVADGDRAPFKVPELRVLTLSATGRETSGEIFTLQSEDESEDEVVRARLNATKWLSIQELPASGNLAETMAQRAWERGEGGRRVVVFCDSRKMAQAVYGAIEQALAERLKERFGKGAPKCSEFIQLMVGARRVREREELAESSAFKRFSPKIKDPPHAAAGEMPSFLVATSAGEVGVDIDADHMVCDLVAWERMVQRLGRVNRLGKYQPGSLVDVFVASSDKDKEAETPAGVEQIKIWRAPFDSFHWSVGQDGRRDASPGALRRLRTNKELKQLTDAATTPAPLRPKLTRALVGAWSMTSLDEHPGRPDVAPWIRGWVDDEPQTSLVWRRHLPVRVNDRYEIAKGTLNEFFEAAPVHLSEILETYTYSVVDLMRARAKALLKGSEHDADVLEALDQEGIDAFGEAEPHNDREQPLTGGMFVAAVLTRDRKVDRLLRLREIQAVDAKRLHTMVAGRTVILDVRMGGLANPGLLDAKESRPPASLDGKPYVAFEDTLPDEQQSEGETKKAWLWDDARLQEIGFRVVVGLRSVDDSARWKVVYRRFLDARADEAEDVESFEEWRVEDWIGDGAPRNEPALAETKQEISIHHTRTKVWAERIAERLALAGVLREMFVGAAAVHDTGKARQNWQAYAGNTGFAHDSVKSPPLAKFTVRGNPNLLRMGQVIYRHEFGSLRDAVALKMFDDRAPDGRDVALHLIAAHHGHARPVIAAADERDPPITSRQLACQAALRFARLQEQWGPWGLAWCEMLLRAADVAASREVIQSEERT